jgi:two-component system chemotaxis sensor kinase CheA
MTGDSGDAAGGLDRFKKTYFEECAELLDAAYMHLAELAEQGGDAEAMNAVFRAVHSIKGGAGAFGFNRLVAFAHKLETLLDMLRSGRIAAAPEIVTALLRATDVLSDLIDAARSEEEAALGFEDEVMQALQELAETGSVAAEACPTHGAIGPIAVEDTRGDCHYRIRFVPRAEMFQKANEPLLVIRALKQLGTLTTMVDLGKLPDLVALEPEYPYLGWTIELDTAAPRSAIDEVFEFVVDDCELTIEAQGSTADPLASPVASEAAAGDPPPSSRLAADAGTVKSDHPRSEAPGAVHSIRVDVEKVDRVVNLVGELVINQAMLRQLGSDLPPDFCPGLINGLETLSQHLRELQESVMAIRAQPVKSVFSRMPRLVREVAAQLGKEVRLVVSGEGTEIDKTVIEQLADPLTHLLRNALDHGIESPDEREARGKPRQGTIHLGAEHRSGRIVIEISDDGCGIDRAKVLAKAQERGFIPAGVTPTDEEIDELIFLPSLSTANGVSSISGRGVGLDVVKRNMQTLGGRVVVE